MYISKIKATNFRLLKDVTLNVDKDLTVIVGKNNSGKTSLTELIIRFTASNHTHFQIEDFSTSSIADFENIKNDFDEATKNNEQHDLPSIRKRLPFIGLQLTINYKENSANYGCLAPFILDFDIDNYETNVVFKYELADGLIEKCLKECPPTKNKENFYAYIKKCISTHFEVKAFASDPTNINNYKKVSTQAAQDLCNTQLISAQRGLDDITTHERGVLGHIFQSLFLSAPYQDSTNDVQIAKRLEKAIKEVEKKLSQETSTFMEDFLECFATFGYPGFSDEKHVYASTNLDSTRLLKDFTNFNYGSNPNITLPETYNGLGTRNLIYITLRLYEFCKTFSSLENPAGFQLIMVEEPEAHLHPQVEEVFIQRLKDAKEYFTQKTQNKKWPVQIIVTTHSANISSTAKFDSIKYFTTRDEDQKRHTIIKELSNIEKSNNESMEFVKKYMGISRCNLLFADKAILVEGASEKILLPECIKKLEQKAPQATLSSQYVTIDEIGGAYAHKFLPLLKFLELPALIITDLDCCKTVASDKGERLKKAKFSESSRTSNCCITKWFNDKKITPKQLIRRTNTRTKDNIHITYQRPEELLQLKGICARSFEDAFILANLSKFGLTENNPDLEQKVWEKSQITSNEKTAFALKYAIEDTDWNIPLYIKSGLQWIATYKERK